MKKVVIIIALFFIYGFGHGQDKFQPLIQRIALLEVYLGYLKSGYRVVKGGLNTIRDFKNGEFGLHKNYFDGLSAVNPKIKQFSMVSETISLGLQLIKECKATQTQFLDSKELAPEEVGWLLKTHARLIDDCKGTIDILIDVITDRQLNFTDDQRLVEIGNLHEEMIAKTKFCRAFNRGAKILILQRVGERNRIRKMQDLYQIK